MAQGICILSVEVNKNTLQWQVLKYKLYLTKMNPGHQLCTQGGIWPYKLYIRFLWEIKKFFSIHETHLIDQEKKKKVP